MPQNAPIIFENGTLPDGFCFTNWQTLFNTFSSLLNGYLPGQYNVFNYGNTEPAAEDRGKPWFRLNPDGSPDKWYVYFGGSWVSPNPVAAGGYEIRIWKGLLADLVTYDGGSAGTVTDTTGPMWEEDTDMRARLPLGVGTLPGALTVVAIGDTGGADQHTNSLAEMFPHNHQPPTDQAVTRVDKSAGAAGIGLTANSSSGAGNISSDWTRVMGGDSATPPAATPYSIMNPYKAVYYIKRTNRLFYTP